MNCGMPGRACPLIGSEHQLGQCIGKPLAGEVLQFIPVHAWMHNSQAENPGQFPVSRHFSRHGARTAFQNMQCAMNLPGG